MTNNMRYERMLVLQRAQQILRQGSSTMTALEAVQQAERELAERKAADAAHEAALKRD